MLPAQDTVIAITSGLKDMQAVLNLVWDKLLPALKPSALPANEEAQKNLKKILASLSIPPQEGSVSPATASKISGKRYRFPSNPLKIEAITLESDAKGEGATVVIRTNGVETRLPCSHGSWSKRLLAYGPLPEQPAAVSGAWTGDDTFKIKICFYETPFIATSTLKFADDKVTLDSESNVGFGPTKPPTLTGQAE